jgi:hypothetical protein
MQKTILAVIAIVAVLVIGWALFRPGDEPPAPPAEPVESPPTPALEAPAEVEPTPVEAPAEVEAPEPEPEEPPLPPLQQSDEFVRERLEPMDLPEQWLEEGNYVRRLAENATRGEYPRRQLSFLAPSGAFKVEEQDGRLVVDPASYDRYDGYVEELVEVNPERLAGLLDTINPLVETALGEVGVQAPPGEVFAEAIRQVLEVPVLEGPVEVVQPNVMYEYADEDLESLSPLKKQVLRMGPENVQKIQDYLRRLAAEMNLEV